MVQKLVLLAFVFASGLACGIANAAAPPKDAERTGTVSGKLTSRKDAKTGKSVTIEILGDGEEKARTYFVAYNPKDPQAKEPFEKLLAVVNTAKVGDRVQCEWVNTPKGSEGGFFVTGFLVLKKANDKGKDGKDKK